MTTLTITLDSIRKHRSASEYRTINRASCEGLEHSGDGDNIAGIAKMLIACDYPPYQAASVVRGSTVCFEAQALEKWASGGVSRGEQPEHLRKGEKA